MSDTNLFQLFLALYRVSYHMHVARSLSEDPNSDAEEEYVKLRCGGTEVLSRPWTDSSQGQVVFGCAFVSAYIEVIRVGALRPL